MIRDALYSYADDPYNLSKFNVESFARVTYKIGVILFCAMINVAKYVTLIELS